MRRNTSLLGILLVLCCCFFVTQALSFVYVISDDYTFNATNCGTRDTKQSIVPNELSTVNIVSDPEVAAGFYIEPVSNVNFVLCNFAMLNAAGHSQYNITITATSGSSTISEIKRVNVQLSNQPPTFGSILNPVPLYTDYFETTPSIPVFAVPVTDDNGFDLVIQGEAGPFSLDTTNIKLISSVADRSGTRFELVLLATDRATSPMSSSVTVTFTFATRPAIVEPRDGSNLTICEVDPVGTQVYTLNVSGEGTVGVNVVTGPNVFEVSNNILKLKAPATGTLLSSIDYETVKNSLPFKVELSISTSTVTVNIYVEDHNDNTPIFSGIPYSVAILETTTAGSSIFKVSATDADGSSPNNVVTLQLSGTGNEKFELNANGELKTKSTLSYAEKGVYNLVVTAMDGAAAPDTKSSSVTVTVSIETAPRFTVLDTNTTVAVAEDHDTATPIYTVAVSDPDSNAVLQYSIVSQSPGQQFSLDGNKLLSSAPLDAETTASYQFVFKVSDGKYNEMSKTLTITVTDVNDMAPVFTAEPPFGIAIIESTPIGTMVMNMSAKDGDLTSPNNVVTYSFTGSVDKFSIDPILGVVTTKAKLNYTEQSSYTLTVTATDDAKDLLKRKTATGVLTISLKTAPRFMVLYTNTTVTVAENHNTAIPIYTVAVSDPDNNAALQYSIVSQSPGQQFSLDGNKLLSSAPLDAEMTASYQFVFNVSDGQNWITSETLKIDVTDVNDNAPQFGELVLSGFVDTASVGSVLFTAQATDADKTSPNNLVTYTLSGNNLDYFSIDAASGRVTLSRAFNISDVSNFQFNVVASDGAAGAAKKTTTKAVSLKVVPEPESRNNTGTNATVGALNERQVKNIRLNGTSPGNLYRLDVYQQKTNQIKAAWDKMAGTSQTEHVVSNLRPGSIIHDVLFITNNLSSVQENLQYLYTGGTMKLGNETVSVLSLQIGNVSYSNSQPDRAMLLCGLHEAIQPCGPSGKCEVKSGRAYCREIADDNFAIIIGVLAGILVILFIILLGVIVMFITKRSRSKEISRSTERSGKSHSYSDRSHHSRELGDMAGSQRALRSGRNLYSNGDPTYGVYPPYKY